MDWENGFGAESVFAFLFHLHVSSLSFRNARLRTYNLRPFSLIAPLTSPNEMIEDGASTCLPSTKETPAVTPPHPQQPIWRQNLHFLAPLSSLQSKSLPAKSVPLSNSLLPFLHINLLLHNLKTEKLLILMQKMPRKSLHRNPQSVTSSSK